MNPVSKLRVLPIGGQRHLRSKMGVHLEARRRRENFRRTIAANPKELSRRIRARARALSQHAYQQFRRELENELAAGYVDPAEVEGWSPRFDEEK